MKLKLILTTAIVGVALALPSVSNAALPSVAGATAGGPTSVLEENCYKDAQGVQVYGATVGVTGFPPNTQFTGTLSYEYINPPVNPDGSYSTGGSVGPATFTTDANGEFIGFLGTVGVKTIFTWTVDSPFLGGTVTKSLTVTCESKPTTKEQCKNDGWRNFPQFKNQGQCIAFVNRGS
jgi:hypothetical protein